MTVKDLISVTPKHIKLTIQCGETVIECKPENELLYHALSDYVIATLYPVDKIEMVAEIKIVPLKAD